MTNFNRDNLVRFLEIGGSRIIGFCIIFYGVLFISIFGGVSELGRFSAVGAILSPLTMFVTFRYIELIGISSDKSKVFTDLVLSAFLIYFFLAVLIGIGIKIYQSDDIRLHDYVMMVLYKFIELFGDILAVVLIQTKRGLEATRIALCKLIVIVILSTALYFFFNVSILNSIYISLIIGFLVAFSIFEVRVCRKYNLFMYIDLCGVKKFIKENLSLGAFNSLMSLNSVIPRYYILYFGDLRQLGIFSLIYQISSVSVNFIEYAAGIYVNNIARLFRNKRSINWLILSSYVVASIIMFLGLLFNKSLPLAYFIISAISMFMVLMSRGISIVICLGLGTGMNYAMLMLASMVSGCVAVYACGWLSIIDDRLFLAFLYVLIASSAFGLILLDAANKEVRRG